MAARVKGTPWYLDAELTPAAVDACNAVFNGRADANQQRIFVEFLAGPLTRAGASTFDPDPQISALLQGRQLVGILFLNAARTHPDAVKALETKQGDKR